MPPLKVYTLGHSGVIIDTAPTEPTVPLDALTNAQNATHDPKEGHRGALRKRAGLKKFNTTFAGGAILGGIPMLVAGTGGAPAQSQFPSVDDSTGSPVGAGTGTGAPGSSSTNSASSLNGNGGGSGAPSNVPSAGAGLFATPAAFYPGSRLMIIGRANNFNPGGGSGFPDSNGWYIVRSDWGTSLAARQQDSTPGPPEGYGSGGTPFPPTSTFQGIWGRPSVFDPTTGYLYYALSQNRTGSPPTGSTNIPSIRKTNGATDVFVSTISVNGPQIIFGMCLSDDGSALFVTTHSISSVNTGYVYKIDKSTGNLTQLTYRTDQIFPGAPFCISTFNGKLWIGEWLQNGNDVNTSQTSTQIDATPVQDNSQPIQIDNSFNTVNGGLVTTCLLAFPKADPVNQILFAGYGCNGASYAPINYRRRNGIGASPISGTNWNLSLFPSDSAAFAGNCWTSMCEFQGKLYAAWRNGSTTHNAVIYQFTPTLSSTIGSLDGGWDGTGTWTAVYTISQGAGAFFWNLYTDSGYIYAIGGTNSTTNNNQAVFSSDGVNWTDKSSTIFGHGVNDDCPMPYVLFVSQ